MALHTESTSQAMSTSVALQPDGSYLIRGYEEARRLMLSNQVTQAGFNAEETLKSDAEFTKILIMLDGEEHNVRRKDAARFFTPKTIHDHYGPIMEGAVDTVIEKFRREGRAELNHLTAEMATMVVARIMGLNDADPGLTGRLQGMMNQYAGPFTLHPVIMFKWSKRMLDLFNLHLRDVLPVVRARRKQPTNDMISHMLQRGRSAFGILAETLMYGVAGIATTQEFLIVCVRELMQNPDMRAAMLNGDREARHHLLNEILRVHPVVLYLYRRAQADLSVDSEGQTITIPKGSLIVFDTKAINSDPRVYGENGHEIQIGREKPADIPWSALAFGTGIHRCVGEFLAIEESDLFLQRFLRLNLEVERWPDVEYNPTTTTYKFSGFIIRLAD
jgi:cytochrome P450